MGPGGLPKGLLADLGRPGPRLGALLAALGRLLGRSWRLLEPSWGAPGGSRGALFVAFGVSVFERPWKKTKTLILLTVHHFLNCFEPPGAKTTSKKPFRLLKN